MTITEGISFDKPMPNYLAYLTDITVQDEVHFEELPEFDCYEWEWNKPPGIYCDTLGNDAQLSKIAKFENEYGGFIRNTEWTAEQIARFEAIERCGHKVIVVAKGGDDADDFTFWLSWSGDRWCLVAIERDEKCGA
jgi:hypothetical protein